MPYKDPEKQRAYRRQYYAANRDSKIQYGLAWQAAKRRSNNELCRTIKMRNGCALCGYNQHPAALQFHHNLAKSFNISNYVHCSSEKRLLAEIAKCVVVCSNCHAIITAVLPDG